MLRAQGHISLLRNHVATLSSLRGNFTSGFVCYFFLVKTQRSSDYCSFSNIFYNWFQ